MPSPFTVLLVLFQVKVLVAPVLGSQHKIKQGVQVSRVCNKFIMKFPWLLQEESPRARRKEKAMFWVDIPSPTPQQTYSSEEDSLPPVPP